MIPPTKFFSLNLLKGNSTRYIMGDCSLQELIFCCQISSHLSQQLRNRVFQKYNYHSIWAACKRDRTWSVPVQRSKNLYFARAPKAQSKCRQLYFILSFLTSVLAREYLLNGRREHSRFNLVFDIRYDLIILMLFY